jgi:hypothetical protein
MSARNIDIILLAASAWLLAVLLSCPVVLAQSKLPAPSRTIYKCIVKGATSYSDEPCAGAQRLDATPSRGVNHLSGSSRTGKDVAREIHGEQFGAALRPLSNMDDAQFATYARRIHLAPAVQRECQQLEPAILTLEKAESGADAAAIKPIQRDLLTLRKRYKTLFC